VESSLVALCQQYLFLCLFQQLSYISLPLFLPSVCPFVYNYLCAYDLNDFPLYKIQAFRCEEQKYRNFVFRLLDKVVKEIFLILSIDICRFIKTPKLIDNTG